MTISDDSFELDDRGDRVLIGLTARETEEFIAIDLSFDTTPPLAQQDWETPEQQRWLELYDKHEAAMKPFHTAGKTRH